MRGDFQHHSAWDDALSQPACGTIGEVDGLYSRPASEVERGCLLRAAKRLLQRIPVLGGLLGQQMPVLAHEDIGGFWRALRKIGRLVQILVHLAGNFNVSLLGDYASLLPNWQREQAPG